MVWFITIWAIITNKSSGDQLFLKIHIHAFTTSLTEPPSKGWDIVQKIRMRACACSVKNSVETKTRNHTVYKCFEVVIAQESVDSQCKAEHIGCIACACMRTCVSDIVIGDHGRWRVNASRLCANCSGISWLIKMTSLLTNVCILNCFDRLQWGTH